MRSFSNFRKLHRYLGLIFGIQLLLWTVSGMYFSWTNLDRIHGDHYKKTSPNTLYFNELISPSELSVTEGISSVSLREINTKPYYFINERDLFDAQTGEPKNEITKEEALSIARQHLTDELEIIAIERLETTNAHHEYRERLLPAYQIKYNTGDNLVAYISAKDGRFQTVRHNSWRVFDWLWMMHTMDYKGRDNFNNITLRIFSAMGLITVLSGFSLWVISIRATRKSSKA